MENATKLVCSDRSASVSNAAVKDLLGTNATKPEYCSRALRIELADAQADFGTPISIEARRGGRPKGYHRASRWYLAGSMCDLCYTPLRKASGLVAF
jgi:hypothetical protein